MEKTEKISGEDSSEKNDQGVDEKKENKNQPAFTEISRRSFDFL